MLSKTSDGKPALLRPTPVAGAEPGARDPAAPASAPHASRCSWMTTAPARATTIKPGDGGKFGVLTKLFSKRARP